MANLFSASSICVEVAVRYASKQHDSCNRNGTGTVQHGLYKNSLCAGRLPREREVEGFAPPEIAQVTASRAVVAARAEARRAIKNRNRRQVPPPAVGLRPEPGRVPGAYTQMVEARGRGGQCSCLGQRALRRSGPGCRWSGGHAANGTGNGQCPLLSTLRTLAVCSCCLSPAHLGGTDDTVAG